MNEVEPVVENGESRYEYSEHLWITTGVPGNDQEGSFMNATLQDDAWGHEFSVSIHVAVPFDCTEDELRDYLRDVFQTAIDATDREFAQGTLNVEIQLGPAGSGEDE